MQKELDMSILGELSLFLGLHQGYVEEIKNGRLKPVSAPMVMGYKLSKDDESLGENQILYRLMIGNILYVTVSRTNYVKAVGFVSIFQYAPKETHVQAVKTIFTIHKGLFVIWSVVPRR